MDSGWQCKSRGPNALVFRYTKRADYGSLCWDEHSRITRRPLT